MTGPANVVRADVKTVRRALEHWENTPDEMGPDCAACHAEQAFERILRAALSPKEDR